MFSVTSVSEEWERLVRVISKVHEKPVFLHSDFIWGTMLPAAAITTLLLSICYVACFQFVDLIVGKDAKPRMKSKMCYQITNVIFNIIIGVLGLYLEYVTIPNANVYVKMLPKPMEKILGWDNELYLVSALQLGYQCWSFPVGILYVKESFEMLAHHTAVVVSVSMTGFLSIGFRYFTPFFYGVMELSSIPLSVMNVLKDDKELSAKYPSAFPISRGLFALSFVVIRNILCLSRWPYFLLYNFVVMWTREWGIYKCYMLIQFSMALLLNFMQLYWGSLIAKALVEVAMPKKEEASKEKKTE